nr:hypothetical protein CFP56_71678 [Quercus suber]
MAISGFLFISWRIFELITLVPIVGMLGWFVSRYTDANLLTPAYVLVLFIVSVLALAWVVFTLISYFRARHDALFVAFVDLCFVGALIAGVYYLRDVADSDCSSGSANLNGGVFINIRTNKECAMLKASFALGIINIIAFFITFLFALLVHRHHRNDDAVVVKRVTSSSHRGGNRHRSRSRDHRSNYDRSSYDNRPSSGRRSHRSQSQSRRQYYV